MECVPAPSAEVASAATPEVTAAVPITAPPSRNCTVPAAAEGDIVAVNVTDWPKVDGFEEDAAAIVLGALFTVCATAADVLPE
jgi:hypothetical protein